MGVVNFCYIYCRKDYSKGLTSHKVIQWPIGFAKNAVVKRRDTNQIFISCCKPVVKCVGGLPQNKVNILRHIENFAYLCI